MLYFTSVNSLDQPMFFIGDELTDSVALQSIAQSETDNFGAWQPSSFNDAVFLAGDGNSTNDNEPENTEEPPEGGPISAIVFEIGMQDK